MSTRDDLRSTLRPLLGPGRYATVLVALALAAVTACAVHAAVSHRFGPASPGVVVASRLRLNDLAVVPEEDARHPGWGRPEQGRAGQPGLDDPRGTRTLVAPLPMRVAP